MTDTNGLLSERIVELERQIAEKDALIKELETSNPAWEMMINAQNEVVKWKKEVIKWQDTDTENQEAIEAKDAEIADLKRGFIDVEEAFKMTETKPEMPSFTEEQIRGWIKEEEDVIRAWIVDEMKRFFNLANKAQMDQQIKVIEACGFKVIPEEKGGLTSPHTQTHSDR